MTNVIEEFLGHIVTAHSKMIAGLLKQNAFLFGFCMFI